MSGVGGYVRRGERRYVPPVADDGIPRCEHCRARLDLCVVSPVHICKEVTFGTPLLPLDGIPMTPTEGTEDHD